MLPIRALISIFRNVGKQEFGPVGSFLAGGSSSNGFRRKLRRRTSVMPRLQFSALEPRTMLSGNTGMEFSITPSVNENGVVTLAGDFGENGVQDDTMLAVDWGDGSSGETFSVSAGTPSFSTTHRFLDDDPTASNSDSYSVSIRVTDENGDAYLPTPFADGPAFTVNASTANHQTTEKYYGAKTVASDANGNFVISWSSLEQDGDGYGVFAQRFDADGTAIGSEIQINTETAGNQQFSSVAMDSAGNFVVTWTSTGQDAEGDGVFAQRFDAAGIPVGSEIQVNTHEAGDQQFSSVAMDAAGNFVIAWSSTDQDGDGTGVFAQRYDRSGIAAGSEFQVNRESTSEQSNAALAMNERGEFIVTWSSLNEDGFSSRIYGQRFDASGTASGSQFRVDNQDGSIQDSSSVAVNGDGEFVVSWSSFNPDGSFNGVYARQFSSGGIAFGSPLEVAAATGQLFSSVAIDADGNFTVVWDNLNPDGLSSVIFAQRYDITGAPLGSKIQISDGSSFQTYTSIANASNGGFIVNWSSIDPSWTNWDTNARQFTVADSESEFDLVVTVNNVAPTFVAGSDETLLAESGGQFERSITFFDVGSIDSHTVTVNFGDGTGDRTVPPESANSFELSHVFEAAGAYSVFVSVEDDDLGVATDSFTVTVEELDGEDNIVDGSFETDAQINGYGFVTPSTTEGWQSLNGEPLEIWESGFNGVEATDGDFFLELDAHANRVDSISQGLQTETGQVYKLTFDIRSRGNSFNTLDETVFVDWNGQALDTNGYRAEQAGAWTTIAAYVVGTGGIDQLLFRESSSPGANDSTGPLLDNVKVERVYSLEAEHLNLSGMVTRSAANASNSQIAKLSRLDRNGSLWTNFVGQDGTYDVSIFVQDESDGQSTIWLDVDGQNVDSILLDRDSDGLGSDNGGFSEFVVRDVAIETGNRISLLIDGDGGEFVRVDRIELHRTSDLGNSGLSNSITIADEDFGSGASGWTNNQTETSYSGERYLGGLGRSDNVIDTSKTYAIPQAAGEVLVSFDFLEIDSWDNEAFRVQINNSVYDLGKFYWNADETEERSWSVAPRIQIQTLGSAFIDGYGSSRTTAAYVNDFRHSFSISIENPDDSLTIGFGSELNHNSKNESWGVDNLLIKAFSSVD